MIRASLAAFINASELATALGVKAYVFEPDVNIGEYPKPSCWVNYLGWRAQEQWVLGDAQRKENPHPTISFYCTTAEQRQQVRDRFQRLIESAKTLDVGGLLHPGIDYVPTADLLRDAGDQKNYLSDQPAWFSTPTPRVFKNEDASGNPVEIFAGFTVDTAVGKVVFAAAQAATDRIRATYKAGLVDFTIAGVDQPQLVDLANNLHRFNVVFGLDAWFHIKTTVNRYL